MKKQWFAILMVVALFACKNETTSATDTSATTSAYDTAGTSASTTGTSGGTTSPLNDADKEAVMKIAQANIAEINAGTVAATKTTNPDVKNFANRMITDHGKAGDELKQLATNKGLALPTETDKEHKAAANKLDTETGKAFDQDYMHVMVSDHEKAVQAFEKTSKEAKDPDLKNWATKTLPTIQDHLKMAKEVAGKVK